MSYKFESSYLNLKECRWLKGNHHTHTTLSDGIETPLQTIAAYEAAGYDYLALSEHDVLADPKAFQHATRIVLVPAVEVTTSLRQTLMFLGIESAADVPAARSLSLTQVAAHVAKCGGLLIIDHPNWRYIDGKRHATFQDLSSVAGPLSIEIYAAVIDRALGSAWATDLWDRLLFDGRKVYGHATDDQHIPQDRFRGFNLIQWDNATELTSAGIVAALASGRFVASTGVAVEQVHLTAEGAGIHIESDAVEVRWIAGGGRVLHETGGGVGSITIDQLGTLPSVTHAFPKIKSIGELKYVRAEMLGNGGKRAFTQPFWIVG